MAQRPLVLVSGPLSPAPATWLAARAQVQVCASDTPKFGEWLARAEGLIVHTETIVDAALLARAPRLRVVGRAGVGLDSVDLPACAAREVQVVYAPDANTQAVVEYVLGLILDLLRPRPRVHSALGRPAWRELRAASVGERQLSDLTCGILGLGRIGSRVCRALDGLGCRVLYNDLLEIEPALRHGAVPVPAADLFAHADVLSLHIDGRPSNRGFVNRSLLEHLKDDAILINTSRGLVVDSADLAAFLRAHPAARAALDVHPAEPFDERYPLLGLPNALLYPHLAGRTRTGLENMSWVVRDVMAVLEGRAPRYPAGAQE